MNDSDLQQKGQLGDLPSIVLPSYALRALHVLEDAGHEAWVVGGFVRDALLGRTAPDVDVATSAPWQDTQRAFEACGYRTHETGTAHGTLTVVVEDHALEITTYRTDGAYVDARHPKHVRFVRTIEEDLARRDFTINALAFHPKRGLLDPFGGVRDLSNGVIRTVGDPAQRFSEDALRIMRACRFVSQLGFSIDPATADGMMRSKSRLSRISRERLVHELSLLLLGQHAGTALTDTADVLAVVLPELVAMKGFEQRTPYHIYDVLEHTAHVVDGVPPYPLVRWAALFHDMGKPATFFTDETGRGHFYGHADVSLVLARGIMERLGMSSAFASRVLTLVERHDEVVEPTPKAVKRMLARLGGDTELFRALCDLKRGDARGQAPRCAGRIEGANELQRVLDDVLAADEAFSVKQLAVNGRDVMAAGVEQGPLVGRALEAALNAVIDGEVPNERDALQAFVIRWAEREASRRCDDAAV